MVNVIRAYGTTVQGVVSGHLEQNLKQIMSQQPQVRVPRLRAEDSFKALSTMRVREGDKDREEHVDTK
jgi:polyhydroxyalkanoate synthesis regulator protein